MIDSIYRFLAGAVSRGGENGKLQIFIFHRVLDKFDSLMPGEPDMIRFDKMAAMLSHVFNVISLSDAVCSLKNNTLPARAACITFDDGYLDNYTNALPILTKYKLPATVFVATDYMQGGMMWNDVVIESIRSYTGVINLDEISIYDAQCSTTENKRELINGIIRKIKHLPYEKRAELVAQVSNQCEYQPGQLMMRENEVKGLHNAGITIGAHTCSHPILKLLDDDAAKIEITRSKEILESLLKEKVDLFAYPNGRPNEDYTARDVDIVKKLGFAAAVSTSKKVVTSQDSIFELPRFTPWDAGHGKFMLRCLYETFRSSEN